MGTSPPGSRGSVVVQRGPRLDSGRPAWRFAAILSDIPERGETVAVDFCGGTVAFSTAAAWLGRVAHVPVMPVECWRTGGLYRLVVHEPVAAAPGDGDAVVMQRVASVLERAIRRAPEWWYPFGDVYVD